MALGALAVVALPREEEPQIIVPMVDVFVEMPGASPAEVEQRVTRPMEKLLWEVPGVEYVYSTSSPGQSMVIVRFKVGEAEERRSCGSTRSSRPMPTGSRRASSGRSSSRGRSTTCRSWRVTLWSARYDDDQLRRSPASCTTPSRRSRRLGGDAHRRAAAAGARRGRPGAAVAYGLDPLACARHRGANTRDGGRGPVSGGQADRLEAGSRLRRATTCATSWSASRAGPVRVGDVATVSDGDAEPTRTSCTWVARAGARRRSPSRSPSARAPTPSTSRTRRGEARHAEGHAHPVRRARHVTRDYGETAAEKSNELLFHMLLAVVSVSILIWLVLGRREAAVVLIAIPVTLALTLFVFYLYGYTLNRITLFALIFSIGILVDDAIVVVENIVRHARLRTGRARTAWGHGASRGGRGGQPDDPGDAGGRRGDPADGVRRRADGPVHAADPVGASAAMIFSLVVAFIVTPWAAVRLLKPAGHHTTTAARTLHAALPRVMGR
jgi:hypothetical protein